MLSKIVPKNLDVISFYERVGVERGSRIADLFLKTKILDKEKVKLYRDIHSFRLWGWGFSYRNLCECWVSRDWIVTLKSSAW